jgi:hypothetical protein
VLRIDPGANSQVTPVFVAKQLSQGTPHLDASEVHEVHAFFVSEIDQMIADGEMADGWLLAGMSILRARGFDK